MWQVDKKLMRVKTKLCPRKIARQPACGKACGKSCVQVAPAGDSCAHFFHSFSKSSFIKKCYTFFYKTALPLKSFFFG